MSRLIEPKTTIMPALPPSRALADTSLRARSPTSSAVTPGLYSDEPMPNPCTTLPRQSSMVSAETPPTTSRRVPFGSTAAMALATFGVTSSPGKSLTACAPASSAAKASVGVRQPGSETIPRSRVRRMTSALQLGETMI